MMYVRKKRMDIKGQKIKTRTTAAAVVLNHQKKTYKKCSDEWACAHAYIA